MAPGVVYTTFHFPESGANVITTDSSDWATNCPEYKVTAVNVVLVQQPDPQSEPQSEPQSAWQRGYAQFHETQLELLHAASHGG
jgi:formate dehydrogenase major subunit